MSGNEFRFFFSCDINLPVTFRIERLEGNWPQSSPAAPPEFECSPGNKSGELFVDCALYLDGSPFGLPTRTRLESSGQPYCWNELITLSTKYRDLTAHAQLALTVSKSAGLQQGLGWMSAGALLDKGSGDVGEEVEKKGDNALSEVDDGDGEIEEQGND
ncbi:hypothetical protein Taro_007359 [Colocasia esculenta]|uniref:C2 PI3K-type domain-containing protein n=1 Tax=Colocasia esculenta TaxID=4460 RepID=A0A843TTV8_COLES|nr:hypothetical protein [Colocasia esculenta]